MFFVTLDSKGASHVLTRCARPAPLEPVAVWSYMPHSLIAAGGKAQPIRAQFLTAAGGEAQPIRAQFLTAAKGETQPIRAQFLTAAGVEAQPIRAQFRRRAAPRTV